MLNNPALIIMDEPTTALDVTVEAAVLDLLEELKHDYNAANIFITHNLGVVARVSDYLCVMYAGQMVESGPVKDIFRNPRHPYTRGLLACVPRLGESKESSILHPIRGRVPPPAERAKTECIFAPRCEFVTEDCCKARPEFTEIIPGHTARCIYALDIEDLSPTVKKRRKAKEGLAPVQTEAPREDLISFDKLKVYYPAESNSVVRG
jgi:peptide/nickel transport system ATP-binding protein